MGLKIYLTIWLIGFTSGLSIMLTGSTLNFWLAQSRISTSEIGFFALVALPYSINFIWSPVLDSIRLPWLHKIFGQRLSWIFTLQGIMGMAVFSLSFLTPQTDISIIAVLAVFIALISSTNDNMLNALRIEIVESKSHGQSAGTYVFGYRIGMMFCTAGVIYLTKYITRQQIYQMLAIMIIFLVVLLVLLLQNQKLFHHSLKHQISKNSFDVSRILASIGPIKIIINILIFLILYRIGDYFIATMINPFVIDLKFTTEQIATVGKLAGSIGAIIGGVLGGYLMRKINIVDALCYFGIIHTSAHLLLALQAVVGNNIWLYFITSISESITGGMAMAAYIGFISAICHGQYKATQQGVLSSMMGISRSIFPSISGIMVIKFGWLKFFLMAFFLSIPSLVMLSCMKNSFKQYINDENS